MLWPLAVALLGGCGGEYVLTAPDVAAPAGGEAPVVVRLQRREFWRYFPPMTGSAITFRAPDGTQRAARTDEDGYAVASVPAPTAAGVVAVELHHQDEQGYTVSGRARLYALDTARPVAAVDLDALPTAGAEVGQAAEAVRRLAGQAQIVYVTQAHCDASAEAHRLLAAGGYPQGAVVGWTKSCPWYRRLPWRDRPPGALAGLCDRLPKLTWGVTADAAGARRFAEAGVMPVVVGAAGGVRPESVRVESWAKLKYLVPPGG